MVSEANEKIMRRFLRELARTANEKDHAAHMGMISKGVRVYGVPGFEALGYDDWYKECQHEFTENILKSVVFAFVSTRLARPEQLMFVVNGTIAATDGEVVHQTAEMLIVKEPDGIWRLQQERLLNDEEIAHLYRFGA